MIHNPNLWKMPWARFALLVIGGIIISGVLTDCINAQDKTKLDPKDQRPPGTKSQSKSEKKADANAQSKLEKKADAKPTPVAAISQSQPILNDAGKLKEQIAALQKEVARLKLKVATLELEKLGAMVSVDKAKDGKETATVNILEKVVG